MGLCENGVAFKCSFQRPGTLSQPFGPSPGVAGAGEAGLGVKAVSCSFSEYRLCLPQLQVSYCMSVRPDRGWW